MISCEVFRADLQPGSDDPEILAHLRSCDGCLGHAVKVDPDYLFRAVGGEESLMPPGGVDVFVDDVMREVRLRQTENAMAVHALSWRQRLAIAATLAVGITGGTLLYRQGTLSAPVASVGSNPVAIQQVAQPAAQRATKPVVETYDSRNATIVEIPGEGAGKAGIVMIFDDQLPADL